MESSERARHLRRNLSPVEWRLWLKLRNRQCGGYKFRRQYPIGSYVVDFYCEKKKFSIELDGPTHGEMRQQRIDAEKERYLADHGYLVTRYTNEQVLTQMEGVLDDIKQRLDSIE